MNETIEKMIKEAQEYGDLHGEFCACMMEDPDNCDCDEMKQIANIIKETVEAENARWVEMCKEHQKLCSFSEGKKELTRMMGKKNRVKKN